MSRLVEYVVAVGLKRPRIDTTQSPELLLKYPEEDHKDFPLPPDVVFFCQPEGCTTAAKRFSIRQTNCFVFTLTDKETGITRYGICCNFFRPCLGTVKSKHRNSLKKEDRLSSSSTSSVEDFNPEGVKKPVSAASVLKKNLCKTHSLPTSSGKDNDRNLIHHVYRNSVLCYSLTSICIISSYPFFSTFKECLFVLRKLVESRSRNKTPSSPLWNKESFSVYDNNQNVGQLPLVECRNWSLFFDSNADLHDKAIKTELQEVDSWIKNFLKIPLPIAGINRVEVELLPRHIQPPLTFALPEKSRFSFCDYPIHLPLELLGVETCLKILTCIMLEHKVVLQSCDYNALSISVMALTSMLYPLEYMFPIIPLLPTCMKNAEQLLLAPTPYVIGIPSSFFKLKSHFEVPSDVLVVDLDTNKMNVPLSMDEIPNLPEPEGSILKSQLKQCLAHLSYTPPPFDLDSLHPTPPPKEEAPNDTNSSHLIYGNDIDSVDIAVRSALVKFFCSSNVLANFTRHTRVLRLYPRPVVAFLREPFIKSRNKETAYIRALVETQAVEFFAEWMVNPETTVFRKCHNGILDPRIIGDKPKWYSHYVQPLYFQVHNPHSRLGCDLYEDSDDTDSETAQTPSTINEEDEDAINDEQLLNIPAHDDENCSCCSSFDDSDDDDDEDDSTFSTSSKSSNDVINNQIHSLYDKSYLSDSARNPAFENSVYSSPAFRAEELLEKVEPVFQVEGGKPTLLPQESIDSVASESVPSATKKLSNLIGSIRPKLQSRLSVDSTASVISMRSMQSVSDHSPTTTSNSSLQKASSTPSIQKPYDKVTDGFDYQTTIKSNPEDQNIYNSENQQIITEVVGYVKSGDGVGWLSTKKLRRILNHEVLRQYLLNQMDIDHKISTTTLQDLHITRNVYRGYMELLKLTADGFEYSMQWKGLGGLTSVFSFLEIAHRYYCGKRYTDDSTMEDVVQSSEKTKKGVVDSARETSVAVESNADKESSDSLHFHRELPGLEHSSPSRTKSSPKTLAKDIATKKLAGMKIDCNGKPVDIQKNEIYLVCKSNAGGQYRFYNNELQKSVVESAGKNVAGTGRRYVYEGLQRNRSSLWDNMEFWEHSFLDAVAAEREAAGMDVNPSDLITRYKSLSPKERRVIEEDEDVLLGVLLHNLVAFMVTMGVERKQIKFKVRRLLAKAHIGLAQSQNIDKVLSNLDELKGNDIDLLVPRSRTLKMQIFVVHLGDTQSGPMFFLEVREDCMVLKSTQGNVIGRWWYENVVNLSCSPKTKVLCVWIRTGEETDLQKICTKKCKMLYNSIKNSMKKAAERLDKEGSGVNLGGDFKVVDSLSGDQGVLKVSLEGVSVVFVERKLCVDVRQLKNCCAKQHLLIVEEYVPHNQSVVKHQFYTEEANEICYAILCLFSYIAAAKNGGTPSSVGTPSDHSSVT